MFKIAAATTYWWPVIVRQPSQDKPGEIDEFSFEVEYRYLGQAENAALLAEVGKDSLLDRQVAHRIVVNFRGVETAAGAALPFSTEALDMLTNEPGVDYAIVHTYFNSRDKAARKN